MPVQIPRRPEIAVLILVIGGIGYFLLCIPAMTCRGFPPIDPAWYGATYLWLGPVCLSALFDSRNFVGRRRSVAAYALITAFLNGATVIEIVPRRTDLLGALVYTVLFFGPLHLLIALLADVVMQRVLRSRQTLVEKPDDVVTGLPQMSLFVWFVGVTVLCMTMGFPFTYQALAFQIEGWRGARQADQDWADQDACVYYDLDAPQADHLYIECELDPDTGFRRRPAVPDWGFRAGYNRRIAQLVQANGLPPWTVKPPLPSAIELSALLDATDLEQVTSFPYEVTPDIVLIRSGTLRRWGSTITNGSDVLMICTPRLSSGVGDAVEPVYVRIQNNRVIVRSGSKRIVVLDPSGRYLITAAQY